MVNPHSLKDIGLEIVVGCSVAHSFLPPWDAPAFQPFPTFQKYYKILIYVVGYIGLNARSTIYPSISINNPTGVNANGAMAQPSTNPAQPPAPPKV